MSFDIDLKIGVLGRDGYSCAMSGARDREIHPVAREVNHRLNRGAGGGGDDSIANACAICWRCNGLIEDDDEMMREALRRGVKLLHGDDPELVPMWSPFFEQWVQLRADGLHLTGVTDATLSAREWSWY